MAKVLGYPMLKLNQGLLNPNSKFNGLKKKGLGFRV
jgi:hypothetical protein